MKYRVLGVKINQYTFEIMSTIEHCFNSYIEAHNKKIELMDSYPDMSFNIDYNHHVSIDEMLTLTSPKMDVSKWN